MSAHWQDRITTAVHHHSSTGPHDCCRQQ